MKIPIFLSCPSEWSPDQGAARARVIRALQAEGFEWRSLGKTDYPTDLPLREVLAIARHCSGGVILGLSQFTTRSGTWKPGSKSAKRVRSSTSFPSPWNQLEAGVLFALGVPLLVFREDGVSGGVFDNGVSDVFVHRMPSAPAGQSDVKGLRSVVAKWGAQVRGHYYGGKPLGGGTL